MLDKDDYARLIPGTGQSIATGAASVQSTAFGSQTYAIRIVATAACHVEYGENPTATSSSALVVPGVAPEYIKVQPGAKLAVIQDSAAGKLSVVELSQ